MAYEAIPQEWVKTYVDHLVALAQQLPPGPMREAVVLRADHVMEMVKAFRARGSAPSAKVN